MKRIEEIQIEPMCVLEAVSNGAAFTVMLITIVFIMSVVFFNIERICSFYERRKYNKKYFNRLLFNLDEIIDGERYSYHNSTKIFLNKSCEELLCKTVKGVWFLIERDGGVRKINIDAAKDRLSAQPDLYIKHFGEIQFA